MPIPLTDQWLDRLEHDPPAAYSREVIKIMAAEIKRLGWKDKTMEETVQVPKGLLQKIHDHFNAIESGAAEGVLSVAEAAMMVPLLAAMLISGRVPGCDD